MAGVRKKSISNKGILAMVLICLGALILLGGLRFYSSRLEYILNSINRGIERYSSEEVDLKQAFSGLTSPIKIYSYCKDMLGMDKAKTVETIRVGNEKVAVAAPSERGRAWRSNVFSIFGRGMN